MKNKVILSFVIVGLLITFTSALHAKDPEDKTAELEQKIADLQRTYLTNNQEMASAISRANTIQEEFNAVKGQTEATAHELRSQREELTRLITDLQTRLQTIEDRMGVFSNQVTSALGKVAPAAAAEAESYQRALDLASSSKYLEAASDFTTFLQKYPKSQYAPNANYWIGECFYSIRDYKRAIKEFQNFIQKYPKDQKVAEALLKQGNGFYELGLTDESRAFYEKVMSVYPGSPEASQAKIKLGRLDEKKAGAAGASPQPSAGGLGSYPTETIEQQRQKMSGKYQAPQSGKYQAPQSGKPQTPQKAPADQKPKSKIGGQKEF